SDELIETKLEDARRRLIEREKTLEDYRRKYSGQLPTQLESNLQLIQNTQMRLQTLTESMSRDRDRRLQLERLIADAASETAPVAAAATTTTAAATTTTGQQLQAARDSLRQMELRLTPEHPDILRAKRAVARRSEE